jgi:pilus assembly protein CpaE
MRAGAREFLTEPFAPGVIEEALVRAAGRRSAGRAVKKTTGKLFVFAGAKGGCGVTTIATNFALCVAQESGHSTLLIDLYLPLGDAALNLGITAQFSTVNALQNSNRLDSNFLAKLLNKHSSGLSVLAAPDKYTPAPVSDEAVGKLLTVARQDFDYVVVDAGSNIGSAYKTLVDGATIAYLVTQVSIPDLRNSNRLITEFFPFRGAKLEVVLNRFTPRMLEIDRESIAKALTLPAKWRIPSDYQSVHRAQNTATPLALEDSPVSAVIRQMARDACGLGLTPEKKKRFNLFG